MIVRLLLDWLERTVPAPLFLAAVCWVFTAGAEAASPVGSTIDAVQPRIVKIYGVGGFRGMEAYQSGMLISPEGHDLTVWS